MASEDRAVPWERQPGESVRAYAAFCVYRDLPAGERSLRRAAEIIVQTSSKPRRASSVQRQLSDWSARWRWVERAAAWDEEQDRLRRARQARAVQEMAERHARQAVAYQEKALRRLMGMEPEELSPKEALMFFIEAAKLERLARGEPDTIQEQRSNWVDAVVEAWARRQAEQQQDAGQ